MYIDPFGCNDSFDHYGFNVGSDEYGNFHGSQCSMCLLDIDETDHSVSTVASLSSSSNEDECDEFIRTVPSEEIKSNQKTKIKFAGVSVREYTVVVGCQDILCPLELDWEYVEYNFTRDEDYCANSEPKSKICPLSYKERQQIIAVSQDVSISDVKYLEQEMIDLQKNNFECENICRLRRIDSLPRKPRSDNETSPLAATTNSNNAMTNCFNSNRNDSPPRRPCQSYD